MLTISVSKNELAVRTATVSVAANATNQLGSITTTNDPGTTRVLWRIGRWGGTPNEFLNADKVTILHPSDVRMSNWHPGTATPTARRSESAGETD